MGIDIVANFYLTNFHCKKIKLKLKVTIFLLVFLDKKKRKHEKTSKLASDGFHPLKFFVTEFSLSVLLRFFSLYRDNSS